MEKQVKNGLTRSIGLSNFNEKQIQDVWDNAEIKPSNLQVTCQKNIQLRIWPKNKERLLIT